MVLCVLCVVAAAVELVVVCVFSSQAEGDVGSATHRQNGDVFGFPMMCRLDFFEGFKWLKCQNYSMWAHFQGTCSFNPAALIIHVIQCCVSSKR